MIKFAEVNLAYEMEPNFGNCTKKLKDVMKLVHK